MPYIDEHRQSLQTLYPSRSQAWLDKKHKEEFVNWLRRCLLGIKLGNQLDALAKGPSSTYLKYQGSEITFYTKNKMERAHTKIAVFVLMLTMKTATCRRHTMVS